MRGNFVPYSLISILMPSISEVVGNGGPRYFLINLTIQGNLYIWGNGEFCSNICHETKCIL